MKDWKAECAKVRGELEEVRKQLQYERSWRESRQSHDADAAERMRDLILSLLRTQ